MLHEGWMKMTHRLPKMDESVSLTLTLFPTPLGGFSPSLGGLTSHFSFLIFLRWLLYSNIIISNKCVHFHYHFFIAHVLFHVGVFVICMLPLPYSCKWSFFIFYFFFFLRSFCEIIMMLHSFQLPSLITPSSLSSCNGKQFGVLRQTIDLLVQTKESGRRNPNNPHIEVMLLYYRKHLGRNTFKYDHMDSKWIDVDCIVIYCNYEL